MFENNVILLNTKWRFPPPSLKIKTITQVNLLRRASTRNLSPKAEAEASAFGHILSLRPVNHHVNTRQSRSRLGFKAEVKTFQTKDILCF